MFQWVLALLAAALALSPTVQCLLQPRVRTRPKNVAIARGASPLVRLQSTLGNDPADTEVAVFANG